MSKRLARLGVIVLVGSTAACPSNCNPTPSGPATTLNLATLAIKGPLTLQGAVPWQCTPWPGSNSEPSTPCPDYFSSSSAPKWVAGDGFAVTDRNAMGTFPKIYVPGSSVEFQANLSFADDTTLLQVTHPETSSIKPCSSNADCLSGTCAPTTTPHGPGPSYCTERICQNSLLPGAVEGNDAHYTVTIQRWDKSATSCPPPQPSLDPDYPAVRFDVPSPTGTSATAGGSGCWVDLSSGGSELFGSSLGAASSTIAAKDGSVTSQLNVPVELTDAATYLRYLITLSEGDSRVPASTTVSGWAPGRASPNAAACDPNQAAPMINAVCPLSDTLFRTFNGYCPDNNGATTRDYYDWTIQHPTSPSFFSYSQALNPFQIVVAPLALVQLKVLPYTLLYMPPGDASKATFMTTTSFGLSMAADNKLAANMSTTVDNKDTETLGLSDNGMALGSLLGGLQIGMSYMQATSWDKSTKTGVGTITDVATNSTTMYSSVLSLMLSNATLTPGATGAYGVEPFWSDTFVLLVHPQVGFWQLGGVPSVSLLAAAGTPASPEFFEPTVGQLDQCYRQVAPYVAGIPIPGTADSLTSADCYQLLQLDPFYGAGQSLPSLASNPRMVRVGGTDYGVDPTTSSDLNVSMTDVITYSGSMAVTGTSSYNATVSDILTSSGTLGLSLGLYGITGSEMSQDTETTTTSTDWTVTLQTSYTATAQSSISVSGSFDDHHGLHGDGSFLPARPHVEVYQDTIFGSFLFQDPSAPAAPPDGGAP